MRGSIGDLTRGDWSRIQEIADHILDLPENERGSALSVECNGDTSLAEHVRRILDNYSESNDLFGAPLGLALTASAREGQRIGDYRLIERIGEGGMGVVYLAERADSVFVKRVAIKVMRGLCDREVQRRFSQERVIQALLDHPNIARVLDGGATQDGLPYLVMELVEGKPIVEVPDRGVRAAAKLFLQVLAAIEHAHQNLVVHRDLKPSNILVSPQGLVKVLDFGIAKILQEGAAGEATQAGLNFMTLGYASPEQIAGKPANTLSDIYSLGAVLYHVISGRPPHDLDGLPLIECARIISEHDPAPPSRYNPAVPDDLDCIVLKALDRDPARRYSSAREFASDLVRYLDGRPVEAHPATWWYQTSKYLRRRRVAVATACGIAALIVAGVFGTVSEARIAARRFDDIIGITRSVMFQYLDDLGKLPGTTALRAGIAKNTVQYLDSIAAAGHDPHLLREVASAYRRVGEVQGFSRASNLGDMTGAVANLGKSVAILESLFAKTPRDSGLRLELAMAQARLADVLSNSGRNIQANSAVERSLALLSVAEPGAATPVLVEAWTTLSAIEERRGQNQRSIEAARQAVVWARRLPEGHREELSSALQRLATALAIGLAPNREATDAVDAALSLYGSRGAGCAGDLACTMGYLRALWVRARLESAAEREQDSVRTWGEVEREARALLARDPNDRRVLRQLAQALQGEGHAHQSAGRIPLALEKFREQIQVAVRIAESDPTHPEATCQEIASRAKYGEVLILSTNRVEEAERELRTAVRLADANQSDSLNCLDYRKVAVINLARVAERKGDWAEGLHWRRETVRNALRYAALTPGEPLGLVIDAGAHFELGLGAIQASEHGDTVARLREAGDALRHAMEVYHRLEAMGNPIYYQYSGWPQRTAALLKSAEHKLRLAGAIKNGGKG